MEWAEDGVGVLEVYSFVTATNFGKNRMSAGGTADDYAAGDPPQFVADLILAAIKGGEDQYFANDHIRKLAGAWEVLSRSVDPGFDIEAQLFRRRRFDIDHVT